MGQMETETEMRLTRPDRVLETRRRALPAPGDALLGGDASEPFRHGVGEFTRFYGMLIDTLDDGVLNGFSYTTMRPARREDDPGAVRARTGGLRRASSGASSCANGTRRSSRGRSRPTARSRRSTRTLTDDGARRIPDRCREHHAAMITQHMRFTAAAMIPTGDFLAHARRLERAATIASFSACCAVRRLSRPCLRRARALVRGDRRRTLRPASSSIPTATPARFSTELRRSPARPVARSALSRPRRLPPARRL